MLVSLCGVSQGVAQTAPAGNAHPESHAVNEEGEGLSNPFGAPTWPSTATMEGKWGLAERVDLSPLRDVAVSHNGRVKIMDTLARETVSRIAGRKSYFDLRPVEEGRGEGKGSEKLRYDPLFTLLDLMIDPAYYVERPLLAVEYLPLRRAFVELAHPGDEAEQERMLKLTRVTPLMAERDGRALAERYAFKAPYMEALDRLAGSMELYQSSAANLLVVSPGARDKKWAHLSTLPEGSPIRQAAAKLGAAWRGGDAQGVNEAVRVLAAELPKLNPETYPGSRRGLEIAYNRSNAFEYGFWAYFAALLTLMLAFGTGRRWLVGVGVATLALAIGLHAFGFVARCVIAERFAIQNQFESMTGLSLFGTLVGFVIMLATRRPLFGAAAAGMGFLVLITATQAEIPGVHIEREAAILNTSVLLKYHVTTVLVSYSLISLGLIVSLFYLGTHYAAKLGGRENTPALRAGAGSENRGTRASGGEADALAAGALNLDAGAPQGHARTLSDLDTAQMTVLQLAFWTLGVGILLGAWWADHSWGRWWAFDPKETWALATWIIYLIVIHVRLTTGRNRGLVTAWLSVVGFVMMLWCYFGVNLLLPGLHAYA